MQVLGNNEKQNYPVRIRNGSVLVLVYILTCFCSSHHFILKLIFISYVH